MPNLTSLVLPDRADLVTNSAPGAEAGTPHEFKPYGVANGVATFIESTGVPLGDKRLTVSQSRNSNGRRKVTIKFAVPVTGTTVVDGVSRPVVLRTNYADLVFNFDEASTKEERTTVKAFIAQMCIKGPLKDAIILDLEGFW